MGRGVGGGEGGELVGGAANIRVFSPNIRLIFYIQKHGKRTVTIIIIMTAISMINVFILFIATVHCRYDGKYVF